MRLAVVVILLIGFVATTHAQNNNTNEVKAEFPGGLASMKRFIKRTVDTTVLNDLDPFFVANNKKNVICSFMIDTLGYVKDIKVEQSVHPLLDEEAIRVIELMPRWEPARIHDGNNSIGRPVNTQWNVPIIFEDPFHDDIIYRKVDKSPLFPGGNDALMKYLNVYVEKYLTPSEYKRFKNDFSNGLSPRTVCNFMIDRDGEIRRLDILRGSDPILDRIALYIFSGLPDFIPAENEGEKVCTNYTLSAFFKPSETNPD